MAQNTDLTITLKALNQSTAAFASLNKDLNALKDSALKLGSALLGALAFRDVISTMEQTAMSIRGIQAETGLTAEAASRLAFAANVVGVSTDELNTGLGRLDKTMFSTATLADKGKDLFTKWGIAIEDTRGNTKNVADVLQLTADRVKQLGDGAAARALEMDLFGRSGGRLHDLLMLGSAGIEQLYKNSDALGMTLNDQTLPALIEFTQQSNTLGKAFDGLKLQLGIILLPILNTLVFTLINLAKWLQTNVFHSQIWAGIIKVLGQALQFVMGLFKGWIEILGRLVGSLGSLQPVLVGIGGSVVILALAAVAQKLLEIGRAAIIPVSFVLVGVAVAEVVATVQEITDKWDKWRQAAHDGLLENQGVVGTFIKGLVLFGDDFSKFGTKMRGVWDGISKTATDVWQNVSQAVGDFFNGLGISFNKVRTNWGPAFQGVWEAIKTTVQNVTSALSGPLDVAMHALDVVVGSVLDGWNFINIAIGEAIKLISSLPVVGGILQIIGGGGIQTRPGGGAPGPGTPDSGSRNAGQFVGTSNGIPVTQSSADSILAFGGQFTHYAKGGIVNRATRAIIGEEGPEAIIPLGRGGGMGNNFYITINANDNIGMTNRELADMVGDSVLAKLASFRGISF